MRVMLQVMLHKPSGLLGADEAEVVFGVLKQYADYGGLWGMLDPSVMEQQGRSVSHYLTGTDALHAWMHGCWYMCLTPSHRQRRAHRLVHHVTAPPRHHPSSHFGGGIL